jgi:hypothetical protein
MRQFRLIVNLENDAFHSDEKTELARILRGIANQIENNQPNEYVPVFDTNGNETGIYNLIEN